MTYRLRFGHILLCFAILAVLTSRCGAFTTKSWETSSASTTTQEWGTTTDDGGATTITTTEAGHSTADRTTTARNNKKNQKSGGYRADVSGVVMVTLLVHHALSRAL